MLNTLLYALFIIVIPIITFALGFVLAFRKRKWYEHSIIIHSGVMAGFYMAVIKSLKEGMQEQAIQILKYMAKSELKAWNDGKHKLSKAEIASTEMGGKKDINIEAKEQSII